MFRKVYAARNEAQLTLNILKKKVFFKAHRSASNSHQLHTQTGHFWKILQRLSTAVLCKHEQSCQRQNSAEDNRCFVSSSCPSWTPTWSLRRQFEQIGWRARACSSTDSGAPWPRRVTALPLRGTQVLRWVIRASLVRELPQERQCISAQSTQVSSRFCEGSSTGTSNDYLSSSKTPFSFPTSTCLVIFRSCHRLESPWRSFACRQGKLLIVDRLPWASLPNDATLVYHTLLMTWWTRGRIARPGRQPPETLPRLPRPCTSNRWASSPAQRRTLLCRLWRETPSCGTPLSRYLKKLGSTSSGRTPPAWINDKVSFSSRFPPDVRQP